MEKFESAGMAELANIITREKPRIICNFPTMPDINKQAIFLRI